MLKEYLLLFAHLSIGPVIIASLIGLVRYRRLPPSLRYLTLLACFDVSMELISSILPRLLDLHSNLFLIPFVIIGEFLLLALAYRHVLQSAVFTKVLPWLLGLFSAYALLVSFSQLGVVRHAISLEIIVDLLVIGLAGLYFRKLLNELHVERLRYDPFFWVSVGLVVNGLGNLLISLFSNYILTHCSVQLQLIIMWGVRNLFGITLYLSYCWALWIASPKRSSVPTAASPLPRA